MIAESEGVEMEDGVLPLILELSGGDMRKAITYLQTGQRLHQAQTIPTPISSESSALSVFASQPWFIMTAD